MVNNFSFTKRGNVGILILIPPSEGKFDDGSKPALKKLNPITNDLIKKIQLAEPKKLYDLKDKALQKAEFINKNILVSKTLPAIERYSGVVFKGIDYFSLKNKSLFHQRVRIISALFGILKPTDNIPNYKLKINKLSADKLWNDYNSIQFSDYYIFDLLPQAHRKAISYKDGIRIEFVLFKNNKKIPAGHQGKHIKGRFVRWLIENDITKVSEFSKFTEEGFNWNGEYFVKKV